jgi:hypothetical protein
VVWSTADGGMISQYADLDGFNQQWQLVNLVAVRVPGVVGDHVAEPDV